MKNKSNTSTIKKQLLTKMSNAELLDTYNAVNTLCKINLASQNFQGWLATKKHSNMIVKEIEKRNLPELEQIASKELASTLGVLYSVMS